MFFVKSTDTLAVDLPISSKVSSLKNYINGHVPSCSQVLTFQGKVLDDSCTLQDYGVSVDSTIHLSCRLLGGESKKVKRCDLDGCNDKAAKIVGDCRYCSKAYCSRHRLPEAHLCTELKTCKQEKYNLNSSKLMDQKCVASKV
ncbi:hypothetical protein O9G_002604 [Rozella allomycis CSF55]|uniref:Uncharacterized protein n=1 Tax=Rozella allomycis (strain CSF55) TaxID=988480 RepID=A0A075ATT8_ROZAC|nr:hypothetical protein O9G_002604 [Rozella allomycis CSF55]|eukprot:EPZ32110.1 hypothetical protein O9G_002604 [Rozella allomycis CSF55]